jgi:hypothetical protein
MLFYVIEKLFFFTLACVLFSLLLMGLDLRDEPSVTFIYPELDTLNNCFAEVFFDRLKAAHHLMEPFVFLRNTVLYDMLNLAVMRTLFLVYGHPHILLQVLLLGVSFGYALVSMFRSSMFSLKSTITLINFCYRLFKYLSVFLLFQCFCDLIYLTAFVLLLSLFIFGCRLAVIFFVG